MSTRTNEQRPFFATPNARGQERDRLLLISYHFPPAQEVGALRWQKFARYVAERGWGLDVVAAHPSSLRAIDPPRLGELPAGTRVYGVRSVTLPVEHIEHAVWRAYRHILPKRLRPAAAPSDDAYPVARPAGRSSLRQDEMHWMRQVPRDILRMYYAWLEYARYGRWARRAAAVALRIADRAIHRAVISCGPPHMAHEGGRAVADATGLPLVIDMRDPWRLVQRLPEHLASPLWLRFAERYERRAVSRAALVVANTERSSAALRAAYPEAADRIITVMNGYDEGPLPPARHAGRFSVAYAGTIYLDRDPRLLFRAAGRVVHELGLTPADFGIDFIGSTDSYGGIPIPAMAAQEHLEGFVTVGPPRPYHKAMEFLSQAALLVSLPQDSDMAIPSKVFEYMRFTAWVLALAEHDSATALVLRDTGADVVAPHDVDGIAAVLRKRYQQYASGHRPAAIAGDGRYSRRSQAHLLLDAIEGVTAGRAEERMVPDLPLHAAAYRPS